MKFRKGSMGAADAKSEKIFLTAATVIVCFVMSMIYFNAPHTFLNDWHKAAGAFWRYVSIIPFLGCIGFMWFGKDLTWGESGGKQYKLISILLLALGILCACGWSFDLK